MRQDKFPSPVAQLESPIIIAGTRLLSPGSYGLAHMDETPWIALFKPF